MFHLLLTNLKLVLILILTSIFLLAPSPAIANTNYQQALETPGMNLSKFNLNNIDNIAASLTKRLVGYPPTTNDGSLGLFGSLNSANNYLYAYKPVNTGSYIADVFQRLNPNSVYAAPSTGIEFLTPTLVAWKVFRNIAYIFFIIIFVALGFMIMFRSKLNPQVTIGIQHALPRIIISLILVTFSYAIAGFVIDIAYFAGDLITNIIARPCSTGNLGDKCILDSGALWKVATTSSPSVWPLSILSRYGTGGGIVKEMLDGIGGVIGGAIGWGGATTTDAWESFFGLIIAFTVIGASFKIFFSLLSKYVTLIFTTIFMPLAFLWGALPGQQNAGTQIFKSFLSASLAFPAVMIFLGLAYYFSNIAGTSVPFQDLPPMYLNQFTDTGSVQAGLIAIGILMIIPSIPPAIDKALGSGPGMGAGTAEIGGMLKKLPIIGGLIG